MGISTPILEADYAITINARGRLSEGWSWTGWKHHKWPANVVRPGLLIYGFDLRKKVRALTVLLKITAGGSFSFRTMKEFQREVQNLTTRPPDPNLDQEQWQKIEQQLDGHTSWTGI